MKKSKSLEDLTNCKRSLIKPDLSVFTMKELLEWMDDFVNEIVKRTKIHGKNKN